MSKSYQHEIGQHFDIIMIIQTIFNMLEKLKDVNAIKTRVKKCIHAFKRCLQHSPQTVLQIPQSSLKSVKNCYKQLQNMIPDDGYIYCIYQQQYLTTVVD